jgi:hypothetical protein
LVHGSAVHGSTVANLLDRSVKTYDTFAKIFLAAFILSNKDGHEMSLLKKDLGLAKGKSNHIPSNPSVDGLDGMGAG